MKKFVFTFCLITGVSVKFDSKRRKTTRNLIRSLLGLQRVDHTCTLRSATLSSGPDDQAHFTKYSKKHLQLKIIKIRWVWNFLSFFCNFYFNSFRSHSDESIHVTTQIGKDSVRVVPTEFVNLRKLQMLVKLFSRALGEIRLFVNSSQ